MKEPLENILSKYPPGRKEGLIPILQEIQKEYGYLPEEYLEKVGEYLSLPANRVHGVATFYNQFRFRQPGRSCIHLCVGTACHLSGSLQNVAEVEKHLKLKVGGTSRDKKFSLEVSNCMGACESAPVVRINDDYYPNITREDITQIIRSLKEK